MSLDAIFSAIRIADTHQDLFRNIISLRKSENLFDDLSDDPADWAAAIAVEMAAKPATFRSETPIIHRPFEEAAWDEAIGYPFREWTKSRYSGGTFGVWYGGDTLDTTVFETVYHWQNGLLADAGFRDPGVSVERRVYLARCDAALIDVRDAVSTYPALVSNDYTVTQQIGGRLHREGHPGLVIQSARCSGEVYAILNPAVLSNPRQHCYLTYTATENGVDVERSPGEVWLSIES